MESNGENGLNEYECVTSDTINGIALAKQQNNKSNMCGFWIQHVTMFDNIIQTVISNFNGG